MSIGTISTGFVVDGSLDDLNVSERYGVEYYKLLNDKTLTSEKFKNKLAQLKAQRDNLLNKEKQAKTNSLSKWDFSLWAWLLAALAVVVGAWLAFSPRKAAAT